MLELIIIRKVADSKLSFFIIYVFRYNKIRRNLGEMESGDYGI